MTQQTPIPGPIKFEPPPQPPMVRQQFWRTFWIHTLAAAAGIILAGM